MNRDRFDTSGDWQWDDIVVAVGLLGFLFATFMGWI